MKNAVERMGAAREFLEELVESPPPLPYEPALMPLLFTATGADARISIEALTALIERSQKLAAKILSLANSAWYAFESKIASLRQAVLVLGFNEVRSLLLLLGAASAVRPAGLPADFDTHAVWAHQLRTALLARTLAEALRCGPGGAEVCGGLGPDEAYAAALLHDIGKFFLAAKRPNEWRDIRKLAERSGMSFAAAELEYWGMDHGLVGAQVLHFWKLPVLLTDAINWHHAPDSAPAYGQEAQLLAVANCLAHEGLAAGASLPVAAETLLPEWANPVEVADALRRDLAGAKAEALAVMLE